MNEFAKTGVVLGSAVLLAVVAGLTGPKAVKLEQFADEGQDFFPTFTDPEAAVELEVTEFREASSEVYKFAVKKDDKGRWTIPSHGNYPADAKDRMGKAAAMFIGLRKERVASDRKDDHAQFEVVDPLDQSAEAKGRGRRITMKDKAGNVLADLVVGKEVENKMDIRYVRVPDKKRVYAVKLENQLSTKFADWIETDLLKAQSWDINKVVFDNYSVDEVQGEVVPGDKLVVRKDDASKWTLEGLNAETEEPNEDKLREIGDTLGQIKIVGVRQKPQGLTAALEQATGFDRQILAQMLADKGFFLGRGGKLYSREGDLLFTTRKGVTYTLRFGRLVPGEGDAVTAGGDVKAPAPKPGEEGPQPVPSNNRYLMVTAQFDPAAFPAPKGVRLPQDQLDKRKAARTRIEGIVQAIETWKQKHDGKLPASLTELTTGEAPPLDKLDKDPWEQDYVLQLVGDTFVVLSHGDDKKEGGEGAGTDVRSDQLAAEDEFQRVGEQWAEHERKVEEGRKEADNLTKRFGPWYYVIDKALFDKLKPTRADLVKAKAAEAAAGGEGAPKTPGGG